MDINTAMRVWHLMRPYLDTEEVQNAVNDFVYIITNNGVDPQDLLHCVDDVDLKVAIQEYLETQE